MIAVLNWALEHWFLIFLLSMLGVFEGVRDFFLDMAKAIGAVGERKHKRRMKELRLQARLAAKAPAVGTGKKPGHCVHRNVTPVISKADELVAWLCKTCGTRLDADWAVREEDL
jgi:hypothetical protein